MNHVKHVIPMSDTSVCIKPEDIQPTVLPDAFIQSDMVRKLNTLSLPRYDQLPNVTLYRDQVIEYIELWMEPLSICVEQPVITPSMINNYVKVGLVPAPVKSNMVASKSHASLPSAYLSRYCLLLPFRHSSTFSV